MVKNAEGPYEGRLKALPENRKTLKQSYPGWAVLIAKLTDAKLRAKDVREILGLSYRQIHHWHVRKLLWYERSSPAEWRRFSIADIFGLALIKRAADLGIPFDKLQKSFVIGTGVPGLLWNALPHLVAGREGFLYTDFESFCNVFMPGNDSAKKSVEVPIGSESEGPIVVLPLKPILNALAEKFNLAEFKVIVNEDGSYSFHINGIPLQLEDLHYAEKEIRESERARKMPGRVTSKHK